MNRQDVISILSKSKDHLRNRYFIQNMELYGSFAKGENKEDSDIDLLYQTIPGAAMTLARLSSLEEFLSGILKKRKIELVNKNALNPIVAANIKDHVISVF